MATRVLALNRRDTQEQAFGLAEGLVRQVAASSDPNCIGRSTRRAELNSRPRIRREQN